MKKLILTFGVLFGLVPLAHSNATCRADAFLCMESVAATAPVGGTCIGVDGATSARVFLYDDCGRLVVIRSVSCSGSGIIDPC